MAQSASGDAVVVTGASRGIGEACAAMLEAHGYCVFAGVRKPEDGVRLRKDVSARLCPILLDVVDAASIAAAARTVVDSLNGRGLVGLINNAGIALAAPLEFLPIEELRRQLDVNVTGQLAVTQAFLPLLRQSKGRVINIGSISGISALPMVGAYCASKFALEALTDSLRVELMPWGISVSIIQPGATATPIWEVSARAADAIIERFPPEALTLYGPMIRGVRARAARAAVEGIPASEVAKAVVHALMSPRPRTRYLVGPDARLRARLQLLPDRLRDRLILRRMEKMLQEHERTQEARTAGLPPQPGS